jgi:hypothetical protein
MAQTGPKPASVAASNCPQAKVSQSIEWYSEGQTRVVDVNGIRVSIRLVGRKGRRARIAISAPPGAVFCTLAQGTGADNGLRDG